MERKKIIAICIVLILIFAIFLFVPKKVEKIEYAKLEDLLSSTSERKIFDGTIVVSDESPYYALISTPLAVYYDEKGKHAYPLLVTSKTPATPIKRFFELYNSTKVFAIGISNIELKIDKYFYYPILELSKRIALDFWKRSDGALIIEMSDIGYNHGLAATVLSSYLNIPVFVAKKFDDDIKTTLDKLKVKYTILCGKIKGYKKVLSFRNIEEIQDITIQYIRHKEGLNANFSYIAIANPLDTKFPNIENKIKHHFEGDVFHFEGEAGVWPGTTAPSKGVDFNLEVPQSFTYGIMRFTLKFAPHEQINVDGERIYAFIYSEKEGKMVERSFFGTPAGRFEGGYSIVDFEYPLMNETGKFLIHVEGRMTYEGIPVKGINEKPVHFYLDVEILRLSSPIYPLMPSLSSLAPYLSAYHIGTLLAKPTYALQYPGYSGCAECGEPSANENSIDSANNQSLFVHSELLNILSRVAGKKPKDVINNKEEINALAKKYYDDPVYIGIIADTNMVPHYYYPGGETLEGVGEPGDTIYANINVNYTNASLDLGEGKIDPKYQDLELPVGRIDGYNVDEASALLARTFFYYDIIDKFRGHNEGDINWKNNAYAFLGSAIPVETMYPSLMNSVIKYATEGGFKTKQTSEIQSHRINSERFQVGSNLIVGGVHGFYYWYVPAARGRFAGGSAYDVAHVRDMGFGPSVLFLVSCVTGRIDGILPQNSLAMAYIHAGANVYIGATRSTVGWIDYGSDDDMKLDSEGAPLLGEKFTDGLIIGNLSVGIALRNAKNVYLVEDSEGGFANGINPIWAKIVFNHYVIHGDPAFNPYEPMNG
ncbi:MAG: C25 family cysteine peptidase [Candidatus Thermoplasmatota archaeon]